MSLDVTRALTNAVCYAGEKKVDGKEEKEIKGEYLGC